MYRTAKLCRFAAIAALAFVAGCASAPKQSPIVQNAPDWVNKGTGAFKDAQGNQVFYGVGSIQGVRNVPLAREAADDRGRAEMGLERRTARG